MNTFDFALIAFAGFALLVILMAMIIVGLREAADPDQAAPEDLTEVERKVIDRDDAETGTARGKQG